MSVVGASSRYDEHEIEVAQSKGATIEASTFVTGRPQPPRPKPVDSIEVLQLFQVTTLARSNPRQKWAKICDAQWLSSGHLDLTAVQYVTPIDAYEPKRLSQQTITPLLECAGFTYPLRKPLSEQLYSDMCRELCPNDPPGVDLLERAVHYHFHRLLCIPPHERKGSDEKLWQFLWQVVDFEEYRRLNPLAIAQVGRLVARDLSRVVFEWEGSG